MEEETIYFTYPNGQAGQSTIQKFEGQPVVVTNNPYQDDMVTLKPGYSLINKKQYDKLEADRKQNHQKAETERLVVQEQVRTETAAKKEEALAFLRGLGMPEDLAKALSG